MPKKITMSPEEHATLRARLEAMSDDDFTILVKPGPTDAPSPANSEIPAALQHPPAPDAASSDFSPPAPTCHRPSDLPHIPS